MIPESPDVAFQINASMENNAETLMEWADLFLAESRQWLDDIATAIDGHDGDSVLLSVQSLKCSLAALSLDSAVERAAHIEQLARDRQWERLRGLVEELAAMCAIARRSIRRTFRERVLN
jgi:HPt (histidine-containing phosphotransfer) domain-containing protein